MHHTGLLEDQQLLLGQFDVVALVVQDVVPGIVHQVIRIVQEVLAAFDFLQRFY